MDVAAGAGALQKEARRAHVAALERAANAGVKRKARPPKSGTPLPIPVSEKPGKLRDKSVTAWLERSRGNHS